MTDDLPERRKGHPYLMYDMLKSSVPGAVRTVEIMRDVNYSFLEGKIYLTGNGTAFHSAALASQILEDDSPDIVIKQAYELYSYSKIRGTLIAFSHTGKTKSTVDALMKASETGNRTVGISHFRDSPLIQNADTGIVIGDSPDLSLCNTKAFFDNYFAALDIISRKAGIDIDTKSLIKQLDTVISTSDRIAIDTADFIGNDVKNIFVLGSGPSFYAAREAAQKLKEATHLHAEGIELEEFNHGCTSVIDEHSAVIMINSGNDLKRSQEISEACRKVGTKTVGLNCESDLPISIKVPQNPALFPVLAIGILYSISYRMALKLNVNPDFLRFEDRRYLDFDSIVFPPGAH